MKRLGIIFLTIILGVVFTFFILNKKSIHAKEEYVVYAFQAGAFEKYENANKFINSLPSGVIIKKNDLYNVYVAIYKNTDVINTMMEYFNRSNINIYLKSISVSKKFYKELTNFEKLIINSTNNNIYPNINQSILNLFLESEYNV